MRIRATAVDSTMGVDKRRNPPGDGYNPSAVERGLITRIGDCFDRARTASLCDRREMNVSLMKSTGEWFRGGGGDDTAAYYANLIGRSADAILDNLQDALFPDPVNYTHIGVEGTSRGTRVEPGTDIEGIIMSARQRRLAERAVGVMVRDMMRECNFQSHIRKLDNDCVKMGSSFATVDRRVRFRAADPTSGPEALRRMAEADAREFAEADGMGVATDDGASTNDADEPKREAVEFAPEKIDPRNFFSGSVEDDRGIEALEWWCEYRAMTWKDLWDRRAVNGKRGGYRNLEFIGEPTENLHRVYYDDILNDGWMGTGGMLPTEALVPLERGWRVIRMVGFIGAGVVGMPDGDKRPTPGQWRNLLREWDIDPDEHRYARWWVAEVAVQGDGTASAGTGVLIRFEPHPYKDGSECPVVMDRFQVISGRFYGASLFKAISGDEDLYNDFVRNLWRQSIMGSYPPFTANTLAIDPELLAENDGDVGALLKPGLGIPVDPMHTAHGPAFNFITMPAEAGQWSQVGMDVTRGNIETVTGVNPSEFGKLTPKVTATNVAAANAAIQVKIKWLGVARETALVNSVANMMVEAGLADAREGLRELSLTLRTVADVDATAPLEPMIGALRDGSGIGAQDFEALLPIEIPIAREQLQSGFRVVIASNAASGGAQNALNALRELFQDAQALQTIQPSFQFDFADIAMAKATLNGLPRVERFVMDNEDREKAMAFQQAQMLEKAALGGGGSPEAKPLGEASAPAPSAGQFDPVEAVQ